MYYIRDETGKLPTLKKMKDKTSGLFISPLPNCLSLCLPPYRSLGLKKSVNEKRRVGCRQKNMVDHLGAILTLLLFY